MTLMCSSHNPLPARMNLMFFALRYYQKQGRADGLTHRRAHVGTCRPLSVS